MLGVMKRPATTLASTLLLLTGAYADEPDMDESVFQAPELTTPACGDEQVEEVVLPEKGFTHPFIKEINRILFIMDTADTPGEAPIEEDAPHGE